MCVDDDIGLSLYDLTLFSVLSNKNIFSNSLKEE